MVHKRDEVKLPLLFAVFGMADKWIVCKRKFCMFSGDTVYVLRDITNEETGTATTPPSKHNYKTIKNVKYTDCDIFKIERLWKDDK